MVLDCALLLDECIRGYVTYMCLACRHSQYVREHIRGAYVALNISSIKKALKGAKFLDCKGAAKALGIYISVAEMYVKERGGIVGRWNGYAVVSRQALIDALSELCRYMSLWRRGLSELIRGKNAKL